MKIIQNKFTKKKWPIESLLRRGEAVVAAVVLVPILSWGLPDWSCATGWQGEMQSPGGQPWRKPVNMPNTSEVDMKGTFSIHTFAPAYDGSDRESSCNVRAYQIPRTADRVQHTCELWFKMDVQTI